MCSEMCIRDRYKGQPLKDGSADSMYTLWKRFVNNSDLDVLKTLYNNINHDLPYSKEKVDTQYDTIFTNFWNTTMYGKNTNPYRLSPDEFENVRLFFFNFIKAWLMEFAYSHHICNQAKSDLNIWSDDGGRDKFCLLYTSPSPRDLSTSRMPSSA